MEYLKKYCRLWKQQFLSFTKWSFYIDFVYSSFKYLLVFKFLIKNSYLMLLTLVLGLYNGKLSFAHYIVTLFKLCVVFAQSLQSEVLTVKDRVLHLFINPNAYKNLDIVFQCNFCNCSIIFFLLFFCKLILKTMVLNNQLMLPLPSKILLKHYVSQFFRIFLLLLLSSDFKIFYFIDVNTVKFQILYQGGTKGKIIWIKNVR